MAKTRKVETPEQLYELLNELNARIFQLEEGKDKNPNSEAEIAGLKAQVEQLEATVGQLTEQANFESRADGRQHRACREGHGGRVFGLPRIPAGRASW